MSSSRSQRNHDDTKDSGTRTIALLRKMESGSVDPKSVSTADRLQLVAFLMTDGVSAAEMAQLLGVSDRSIERYKRSIRAENSIAKDPALLGRMVGRLMAEADVSIQRIRKAIRSKGVPDAVKVDGNHRCVQIFSDLVKSFQSLGYLPTAAQKVEADLTHHVSDVPSFADVRAQFEQLRQVAAGIADQDGIRTKSLRLLEDKINQADLATKIEDLTSSIKEDPTDETE